MDNTTLIPSNRNLNAVSETNLVILRLRSFLLGKSTLLGQKHGMDIGQDTSTGNGDISQKLVQFLIILDRQRDVSGDDTSLFVIPRGISCQFEDFGTEIFEDGSEVDGRSSSDASSVFAEFEVASDTTDGELEAGFGGTAHGSFLFSAASLSFSFTFSCCEGVINEGVSRSNFKNDIKVLLRMNEGSFPLISLCFHRYIQFAVSILIQEIK